MINVENLAKDYKIYNRDVEEGLLRSIKSIIKRDYILKRAVDNVTFSIDKGEIVGYVGPNGAGKSTTIKMLSGILMPTSGSITVNGVPPHENRINNAMNIGAVFGQRTQLYWDLPLKDSFLVHKKLYDIDTAVYEHNVKQYVEVLQMEGFMQQPVRQLSLGQKMRANIAIALLHNPQIIYLDEPTIGLDIVAKRKIREFIKHINKEKRTTILLTTHDMDDIEEICERIIVIDKARIRYDGNLKKFKSNFGDRYSIEIEFESNVDSSIFHPSFEIIKKESESRISVVSSKKKISISEALKYIIENYPVKDINVKEGTIEDILINMYSQEN